ncbi:MAG: hypothetical protein PHY93_17515 [Bacteriovorax sp.]|nr:hypothetical protein [Bacteriovorax sp.]
MKKKLIPQISKIIAPLVLTFALSASAFATCDIARLHVVRSEGPYGGVYYYDLAPATVSPVYYYRFAVNNGLLIHQLDTAWLGHLTVRAVGDAATCGNTGTIRGAGNLTFVYRDSFF